MRRSDIIHARSGDTICPFVTTFNVKYHPRAHGRYYVYATGDSLRVLRHGVSAQLQAPQKAQATSLGNHAAQISSLALLVDVEGTPALVLERQLHRPMINENTPTDKQTTIGTTQVDICRSFQI
jgi:hypothetical protein